MHLRPIIVYLFSLGLLAGLSACGQKGPLYLPDQDQAKMENQF
jgi:predicted small lipoprotein YifL